ncbi:MAG: precorrin-6B C5,15-methyltransferase / cobalt-precorrin-6B C5,C15-methyltransferase [Acidimicrobiaceae bacterium]|nr:precorrin-6B C5,15-methyltransferase / cobalt-precorrin-6B C5,C15-methyltransferase [Acidimicrobiaceae bacterium]
MPRRIRVVGMVGDTPFGPVAGDLVVGGHRQLAAAARAGARTLAIEADVGAVLDAVAREEGDVCVLASGDPGFFGIVRPLAARFGPGLLDVHPAPSSVAVAFARLGLNWDDAVVVSAHGRPLSDAADTAAHHDKVAVLVSPESPPEAVGKELLRLGAAHRQASVCSRLGLPDESVTTTDLAGLAGGTWDPLSVVVLVAGPDVSTEKSLAWGVLDDDGFDHRAGMITKAEVRAVALSKLALPAGPGVAWDVGAGSGSVAVECARAAPALEVYAVERNGDDVRRIEANAESLAHPLHVVHGEAPACLDRLPDPDRAFVGGGGIDVLDAVLARLRPGGRVVATYAAIDRAAAGADRLGSLVQVGAARGRRLPDGGWRLAAENPVFVVWGPTP